MERRLLDLRHVNGEARHTLDLLYEPKGGAVEDLHFRYTVFAGERSIVSFLYQSRWDDLALYDLFVFAQGLIQLPVQEDANARWEFRDGRRVVRRSARWEQQLDCGFGMSVWIPRDSIRRGPGGHLAMLTTTHMAFNDPPRQNLGNQPNAFMFGLRCERKHVIAQGRRMRRVLGPIRRAHRRYLARQGDSERSVVENRTFPAYFWRLVDVEAT